MTILIVHSQRYEYDKPRAYHDWHDARYRLVSSSERYYTGQELNNYPVPALRDEIEIQPDRVILWRKSQPFDPDYEGPTAPWGMRYLADALLPLSYEDIWD